MAGEWFISRRAFGREPGGPAIPGAQLKTVWMEASQCGRRARGKKKRGKPPTDRGLFPEL